MVCTKPSKTARKERPVKSLECDEPRKSRAFAGYVSAIAARGIRLADLVLKCKTTADFAEIRTEAKRLIDLTDGFRTNGSVVELWERFGGERLLAEECRLHDKQQPEGIKNGE